MKKHIRLLSVLSFSLVLSAPVFSLAAGGDQEIRKERKINRSYPVTAEDKLKIDNQFGNVVVSTWDKNEITVDVEISASASTDERAQDILNKIDVKDERTGHDINFKTNVDEIHEGNGNKGHHNDGNRSFYIDYVIHMPANNPLDIANSFGKTEIPDFKGEVSLTSKFGSLTTGKLDKVALIDVEFGKANIAEVNDGKVVFKFNGQSRIGMVNGNVKITSEFSNHVQLTVGNIQELSISESYSGVRMIVTKSLSAEFDVHTSFGSFHNESEYSIREQKGDDDMGPHFDRDYSGKAGDGKAKIRIKSSFGSVRLAYSNGDEDRDDEKEKNKEKDKEDRKGSKTVTVS
jgi:hypothetical protein